MKTISEKEIPKYQYEIGKTFIITIAIILLVFWAMRPEDSMTKCQETHSFDTCFSTLNR